MQHGEEEEEEKPTCCSTSKSNFRVSTRGFNLEPPAHYKIIILLAGSGGPDHGAARCLDRTQQRQAGLGSALLPHCEGRELNMEYSGSKSIAVEVVV